MLTKEEALKQIEELKKFVEGENEWPQEGDKCFWITFAGNITEDTFYSSTISDKKALELGNLFRTKEEAEMERLRRESRAKAWIPEEGGLYWFWSFRIDCAIRKMDIIFSEKVYFSQIGNAHPTEEACEEWGKKYAKAFEHLIK